MVVRQETGEPNRRGGLGGSQGERTRRLLGIPYFFHQLQDPVGILQQPVSGGGQDDSPTVPVKESGFQIFFQATDAGGYIGLNVAHLPGGSGDIARLGHLNENFKILEFHNLHLPINKNDYRSLFNHFTQCLLSF